jgi:ATP-binding cassette subfamily B protein
MKKNSLLDSLHLLKNLWNAIDHKRRRELFYNVILATLTACIEIISIGAAIPFLGVLINPQKISTIISGYQFLSPILVFVDLDNNLPFKLVAGFILLALLAGFLRLTLLWVQTNLAYGIGADLSQSIYRRTLYQDYETHKIRNTSEVISTISVKVNHVVASTIIPIINIISSVLLLVFISAALIAINPIVSCTVFFGFGVVYFAITIITKTKLAKDGQIIRQKQNETIKLLQEGLGGIRDILIDGTQNIYSAIFARSDNQLRRSNAHISIIAGSPRYIMEAFGTILIASIAYYLIFLSGVSLDISLPILGALAMGCQRLLPLLQQLYQGVSLIIAGNGNLTDVLDLLSQKMPIADAHKEVTPITFKHILEFKNVHFHYQKSSKWALKNISLKVASGERIGIIGKTGSGKSTLADIFLGLLQPLEGSLEIDGVTISYKNFRSWQTQVAHVPQSVFLADLTITENVAFGIPKENINISKVLEACKIAQIDSDIRELPHKYDTVVGENGSKLSGGQRQRIGLARALYKGARLIVLDEATSALDNETEQKIINTLDKLNVTLIMIAHRLSSLKNCNTIIELSNGEISRVGTVKEIIGENSILPLERKIS